MPRLRCATLGTNGDPHDPACCSRDRATRVFTARLLLLRECGARRIHRGQDLRARGHARRRAAAGGTCSARPARSNFTAGTLLWPFVFVFTDVVNRFFGRRGVRLISWTAAALIACTVRVRLRRDRALPAGWWVGAAHRRACPTTRPRPRRGVRARHVDHRRFAGRVPARPVDRHRGVPPHPPRHRRAHRCGARPAPPRSRQLVDSFVVLYIAFVLGPHWPIGLFFWRSARSTTCYRCWPRSR